MTDWMKTPKGPQLPDISMSAHGTIMAEISKSTSYSARMMIATVTEMLGGADGLAEWVKDDPKNLEIFWSKIFPKLVQPEKTQEDKAQTIEDILKELDARDAKMIDVEKQPIDKKKDAEDI